MHEIALDRWILLAGILLVAVTLRPLRLPTVMFHAGVETQPLGGGGRERA